MSQNSQQRADTNKLSVVLASILIFLVSDNLIPPGYFDLGKQLVIFGLVLPLDMGFLYSALVSALSIVGMYWILADHPIQRPNKIQHLFIPALFVFILGMALKQVPIGATFWVILVVGAGLLYFTLVSEYITVDITDLRYPMASVAIQTLGYLIFFIFVAALNYGNQRFIFQALFIATASFAISQRSFFLRFGVWKTVWAFVIAFILTQITLGFHYLPLRPYQFGLFSIGVLTALVEFTQHLDEPFDRKFLILPGSVLLFFVLVGSFLA